MRLQVRPTRYLLALCSLLLGLTLAGPALAELVVITKPSVQMRAKPQEDGKPIAIVYGNDTYDVLDERERWVQIRAAAKGGKSVTGWVPRDAVYPIIEPIARKSLAYALELKNAGKDQEARAKLFEVMTRFRGTSQAYAAARALQTYHPGQAELPELTNGIADAKQKRQGDRIGSWLLVEEGRLRVSEKRYDEAVSLFEEARAWGKLNRSAMDGIRVALQTRYRDGKDREGALIALKAYFPNAKDPTKDIIQGFGLPKVMPPTMAPLVEPGPPIEEQDDPSGLHDFERKELELAPQENGNGAPMPEQEKSEEAPAPEGDSNARSDSPAPLNPPSDPADSAQAAAPLPQDSAVLPADKSPAAQAPAVQSPDMQTPAQQAPRAQAPEIGAPVPPPAAHRRQPARQRAVRRPPAQAELRLPGDPAAESAQVDNPPSGHDTQSGAHTSPQSSPPGFAMGEGAGAVAANPPTAQNGAQSAPPLPGMRPLKRGLWPGEPAGTERTARPTPPPLLSELSERPPSAAKP